MSWHPTLWWQFFRLKSWNPDTRLKFANQISQSGDIRRITKLIEAVKGDDFWTIRLTAIVALGNLRNPSSVDTLVNALTDSSAAVRVAAASALGVVGDRRAGQKLILLVDARQNEQVRQAAVTALGKIRDPAAVSSLMEIVKDADDSWAIRKTSIEALGEIRDPRAVDLLIDTLNDQYASVREASALALGKIGSAEATTPLLGTLDTSTLWGLRVAAANALGEIRDRRAVLPLTSALKDRYAAVREAAAHALGKIQDAFAIDPLIAALDDANATVQDAVINALDLIAADLPNSVHQRVQAAIARCRRATFNTYEPFVAAAITHNNVAQKALSALATVLTRHGAQLDGDTLKDILAAIDQSGSSSNELPRADLHWEENLTRPVDNSTLKDLIQQQLGRRE